MKLSDDYYCEGQMTIYDFRDGYKKRKGGETTTLETRAEAGETVDKRKRYSQIIECLIECSEMTAKEIAVVMMQKGYIPTSERNFTAPRLTELSKMGVVEPVGKKICTYTGKKVAVYALRDQAALFEIKEA